MKVQAMEQLTQSIYSEILQAYEYHSISIGLFFFCSIYDENHMPISASFNSNVSPERILDMLKLKAEECVKYSYDYSWEFDPIIEVAYKIIEARYQDAELPYIYTFYYEDTRNPFNYRVGYLTDNTDMKTVAQSTYQVMQNILMRDNS